MLLVELFSQPDQKVVVLNGVCDSSKLLRDLTLLEEVGNLGPVVLMLGAERVRQPACVVLKLSRLRVGIGR